jgi:hypothetical protein
MSTLEDLRKNLLTMTPDEIRERIRFSREDRKLSKTVAKSPAVRRAKGATKAIDLFKGLSQAQQLQLLKKLGTS